MMTYWKLTLKLTIICALRDFFYRIFQRFPDLVSGSFKIGFLPTSPLAIVKLFRYCIMADQLCQKTEYHAREILFKPGE